MTASMTVHEYGAGGESVIVLIHPSMVMWDYFEYVVPLLEKRHHLIIPALPGYDESRPKQDFTSVEDIAGEVAGRSRHPEGRCPVRLLHGRQHRFARFDRQTQRFGTF